MSFWTALVVIVAAVMFASTLIARYRASSGDIHRGKFDSARIEAEAAKREEDLKREIEDLRERIAVLERIATEDRHGKAIAAEIESLRDN
jgi:cell division protein FtsB